MGKAASHPTPEQRAAIEAELRRHIDEQIRKARWRPSRQKRKPGGGRKPLLPKRKIAAGQAAYRRMLKADRTWAKQREASAKRLIEALKLKGVSWWTVKRWIVAPVLQRPEHNKRRRKAK